MRAFKFFLKTFIGVMTSASLIFNSLPPQAHAGESADKVINYASTLIGISGRPNIITEYWGLTTECCAETIVYVGDKTGVSSSFPRSTFVDRSGQYEGFRDWFEARNRFHYKGKYTPVKGDLIIFDYNNDNIGDHIGFVSDTNLSTMIVYTIEENANDRVATNAYHMNSPIILGYCRPYYNDYEKLNIQTSVTASTATISTTISTTTTATTAVTTTNNNISSPNFNTAENLYYVSSLIGCNLKNAPNFNDESIIEILDTSTKLYVQSIKNNFAYVQVGTSEQYGYVHISTISPAGHDIYNYGCAVNYYVSSEIGCKLHSVPKLDDKNVITILDSNTQLTMLSQGLEFSYCEIVTSNNSVLNGYIHNSVISPIKIELNRDCYNFSIDVNNTTNNISYVTSDIGCKFRSTANFDDNNVIAILDTNTPVNKISNDGEFFYCSVVINNSTIYGYIHSSVIL